MLTFEDHLTLLLNFLFCFNSDFRSSCFYWVYKNYQHMFFEGISLYCSYIIPSLITINDLFNHSLLHPHLLNK